MNSESMNMHNCNNISIAIHSSDEDGTDHIPFQSNQSYYNQINTTRMYQLHHNPFSINRNDITNPTMLIQTAASTMGPNHPSSSDNDIMTIDSTFSVVDNCQANERMDVETLNAALALIQTKNNSQSNANDNQTHLLFHNICPSFILIVYVSIIQPLNVRIKLLPAVGVFLLSSKVKLLSACVEIA